MNSKKYRQHQIIWEDLTSPIPILQETQKKLIELLAEMVSNYWENNNDQFNPTKENKHDK